MKYPMDSKLAVPAVNDGNWALLLEEMAESALATKLDANIYDPDHYTLAVRNGEVVAYIVRDVERYSLKYTICVRRLGVQLDTYAARRKVAQLAASGVEFDESYSEDDVTKALSGQLVKVLAPKQQQSPDKKGGGPIIR